MPRLHDIENISDAIQDKSESKQIVIYDTYCLHPDNEIIITCTAYNQNNTENNRMRVNFIIRYNSASVSEKLNSILDDMRVFREPIIHMNLKRFINDYFGGSLWQDGNRIVYIMDDVYIDYYEIKSIS